MTVPFWILFASWIGLVIFVFYLAKLLREQRGDRMVAEQYAIDLKAQLKQMMKARTIQWNEDDDEGAFISSKGLRAIDPLHPDDWLDAPIGAKPVRERGGSG